MTVQLAPVPVFKAFDNNGEPLAGGLLGSPCGQAGGFVVSTGSESGQPQSTVICNAGAQQRQPVTYGTPNYYPTAGNAFEQPGGRKAGSHHHCGFFGDDGFGFGGGGFGGGGFGFGGGRRGRGLTVVNEQVAGPGAQGGDFGQGFSDSRFLSNRFNRFGGFGGFGGFSPFGFGRFGRFGGGFGGGFGGFGGGFGCGPFGC